MFIKESDVRHAVCNAIYNSDCNVAVSTVDAVMQSVEAEPKYECREKQMVDFDVAVKMLDYVYEGEMNDFCITPTGMKNMLRNLARPVSVLEVKQDGNENGDTAGNVDRP